MVSDGQVVWLKRIEELHTCKIVHGDTLSLILWRSTLPQWREIPQVAEVDAVMWFPTISKCHELDHCVGIDQMTMIIGAH
jgi:hypothetical protein